MTLLKKLLIFDIFEILQAKRITSICNLTIEIVWYPLLNNSFHCLNGNNIFYTYLYITKSWSIVFNVVALTLSHVNDHVIPILFFFFNFYFTYNFKTIFTNFKIVNPSPIINMYNKSQPLFIYLLPPWSPAKAFST